MNENIENKILLRSTGELPPEEITALEQVLDSDPEAADFAQFIAERLPNRAPRDFAAAAIRDVLPDRDVVAFPRLRTLTAAAAAVLIASWVATRFFTADPPQTPVVAQNPTRLTTEISVHLDTLEKELTSSRQRIARGRYTLQPDTL